MVVGLDIHIVRVFILTPKKKPGMFVKKVMAKRGNTGHARNIRAHGHIYRASKKNGD